MGLSKGLALSAIVVAGVRHLPKAVLAEAKGWAKVARIVVLGDGDTDLDLHVYDENGNVMVSDTDYTNQCVLEGRRARRRRHRHPAPYPTDRPGFVWLELASEYAAVRVGRACN